MRAAALALVLAACVPSPPQSLAGVWRAEVHEANAPQPIVVVSFTVVFAELGDGQVVGLGSLRGLVFAGICEEHRCWLRAQFGQEPPMMTWIVWPDSFGFDGRILDGGFSYGVVRLRRARGSD